MESYFSSQADWTPTFQPSDELDRDARLNCYDDNAKDYDVDLKNYGYGAPAIAAQAVHQQLNGMWMYTCNRAC